MTIEKLNELIDAKEKLGDLLKFRTEFEIRGNKRIKFYQDYNDFVYAEDFLTETQIRNIETILFNQLDSLIDELEKKILEA